MRGIVACEALYPLIERFGNEMPVRYVPAELHEFPINVPIETAIAERVQAAVDDLDGANLDAIVVSYATAGNGLDGVRTRETPLIVSRMADCTSTVLPTDDNRYGENKAPGTLYLTRGWIDCGVDSYKLYYAYRGTLDPLLDRFEAAKRAHPDLRISWPDGDRFAQAADRDRSPSPGAVDRFFHNVVQHYDTVALIDTGDLYDFHFEYAESVRNFVHRLRSEQGSGHDVDLVTVEGRTDRFGSLLTEEGSSMAWAEYYPPGEPIDLGEG